MILEDHDNRLHEAADNAGGIPGEKLNVEAKKAEEELSDWKFGDLPEEAPGYGSLVPIKKKRPDTIQ